MELSHFEMQDRWPKNFINSKDLISPMQKVMRADRQRSVTDRI